MSPPRSVRPIEPAKSTSPPKTNGGSNCVEDEDDRAGAVAGDLADLELEPGQLEPLAVVDQAVGLGAGDRQAERGAHVGLGVREQGRLVAADDQRRLGECLLHRRVARDVVGVAVRVQDRRRAQAAACSGRSRIDSRVESRIDHEGLRPPGQPDHVADLRERGRFDRFNRIVRHQRSTPPSDRPCRTRSADSRLVRHCKSPSRPRTPSGYSSRVGIISMLVAERSERHWSGSCSRIRPILSGCRRKPRAWTCFEPDDPRSRREQRASTFARWSSHNGMTEDVPAALGIHSNPQITWPAGRKRIPHGNPNDWAGPPEERFEERRPETARYRASSRARWSAGAGGHRDPRRWRWPGPRRVGRSPIPAPTRAGAARPAADRRRRAGSIPGRVGPDRRGRGHGAPPCDAAASAPPSRSGRVAGDRTPAALESPIARAHPRDRPIARPDTGGPTTTSAPSPSVSGSTAG